MKDGHLSIGIDVGTTTFHYVINRIHLERQPSRGGFSRFKLAGYAPVYQSPIFLTPYGDMEDVLDRPRIVRHLTSDLEAARFLASDMATGSVIVTGQAAKRRNAEALIASLAALFPQMVSTIAGSRLESLLAARGARVDQYSRNRLQRVINIDIGGGTTNVALFQNGKPLGLASLWLGGRMMRLDGRGRIRHMTPAAESIAARAGLKLSEGVQDYEALERFAQSAGRCLFDFIAGKEVPRQLVDFDDLPRDGGDIDAFCFTGGVAELMRGTRNSASDWLQFEDVGVLLAKQFVIGSSGLELFEPDISRIRATAIGVGVHHLQVAGSTIYLSNPAVLPLVNIPVAKISLAELEPRRYLQKLTETGAYFEGAERLAYCFEAGPDLDYAALTHLAQGFLEYLRQTSRRLLIAVFDRDLGKVFGYIAASLCRGGREMEIVSIDGISVEDNTTLDVGVPLAEGVLPVCAKTLYF